MNDRPLRPPKTGVGHYVEELLQWLPRVAGQHRYVGFFTDILRRRPPAVGSAPSDSAPGTSPRRPPEFVRRLLHAGYNAAFRLAARPDRYDLYHEPNHIAIPWQGPIVTTVHDMSVVRHPEWHPRDRVTWYEREFAQSVRRTTHFICPSAFSKSELVTLAGVDPDRVTVIPLAPREPFRQQDEPAVASARERLALPQRFLIFVGTLEPRKNIGGLLEAYARIPLAARERYPLVLVGAGGWRMEGLWRRAAELGVRDALRPIGYVSEADLACLYTAARALVWPSWYEGFGLPPLECMACGTPVITSRTTSLPEVVGDAAIQIVPDDPAALAYAMRAIIEDDALAADLAARGPARAAEFTWQRCAAAHAAVYEGCLTTS